MVFLTPEQTATLTRVMKQLPTMESLCLESGCVSIKLTVWEKDGSYHKYEIDKNGKLTR